MELDMNVLRDRKFKIILDMSKKRGDYLKRRSDYRNGRDLVLDIDAFEAGKQSLDAK